MVNEGKETSLVVVVNDAKMTVLVVVVKVIKMTGLWLNSMFGGCGHCGESGGFVDCGQ